MMTYHASTIMEQIREAAADILDDHIEELESFEGTHRDLVNHGAFLVLNGFDDILDRDFARSLVEDYLADREVQR